MFLRGSKNEPADRDPSCLKIDMVREGTSNCWFKVMPRFKVRFEGEKVC